MDADLDTYLAPTTFLDCDSPVVVDFARRACDGETAARAQAVRLYYAVRDGIWYNPYTVVADPEAFKASVIARARSAFCVQKAILLTAAARAVGIPSRLAFADVRNHLTSEKLRATMGTDIFVFHGYSELHLGGKWLKATPTFNRELCERFGVLPLEFDGTADAIFQPFDAHNRRHMEYIRQRGSFADLPFDEMIAVMRETYGATSMTGEAEGEADKRFARLA
ncbi:MAG: transglutaminase family protein [Candidatus Binatia bacterium]